MTTYQIGGHSFLARTIVDATTEAVDKARELYREGAVREAEALHREALGLRRLERALAPSRPGRPDMDRSSNRFRRSRR